jgi:GR25 family glycosyltransferase involved in LPS biosynthesis
VITAPSHTFYAISLDPAGERYRLFAERNRHLGSISIFNAIKGADIPMAERVSSGLLTPELLAAGTVTEGTLGCAASHRAVWRIIAASNTGAVVMEDDVLTHPGLPEFMAAHPKILNRAELVFFSVNTDSVLATISPQGLTTYEVMQPQRPDLAWIGRAFAQTAVADVRPHRLLNGFGLCCYWVSPRGAARLLDACYPLTLEGTDVPLMKDKWPGSAIDGRMNAFLPAMSAFITRPFLAYSPNTDSSTSI